MLLSLDMKNKIIINEVCIIFIVIHNYETKIKFKKTLLRQTTGLNPKKSDNINNIR